MLGAPLSILKQVLLPGRYLFRKHRGSKVPNRDCPKRPKDPDSRSRGALCERAMGAFGEITFGWSCLNPCLGLGIRWAPNPVPNRAGHLLQYCPMFGSG